MNAADRSTRPVLAVVAALTAALALPGLADAASLSKPASSRYQYAAASGEVNQLEVVRRADGQLELTDTGAVIAATASASGCAISDGGHRAVCPGAGITALTAQLGDLDDTALVTAPVAATLWGGPGTDELTGGPNGDVLHAGPYLFAGGVEESDEILTGNGGDDLLDATQATGIVELDGGEGRDTLNGNPDAPPTGESRHRPSYLSSEFAGGPGNDVIRGSGADDRLSGGPGADDISGGGGEDGLSYGDAAGAVTVNVPDGAANDGGEADAGVVGGVARRDRIAADVEAVAGGDGNDRITMGPGPSSLFGGPGNDVLDGGDGDDVLDGGADESYSRPADGDDTLIGGPGDDRLTGGYGADVFDGGPGRLDSVGYPRDYEYRGGIVASIGNACTTDGVSKPCADDGAQGEHDTILGSVEVLTGTNGSDTLIGSNAAQRLYGYSGSDRLVGNGGNDLLCGEYRGTRPGTCSPGGLGGVSPTYHPSDDKLSGGPGDDMLGGGKDGDEHLGGTGIDTVSYEGTTTALNVTIGNLCMNWDVREVCRDDGAAYPDTDAYPQTSERDSIAEDVENVIGGNGADTLAGSAQANVLNGLGGDDTLAGGAGNDTLIGDTGADAQSGGPGFDFASYRPSWSYDAPWGVRVDLDGVADDGRANTGAPAYEGDNVKPDVEGVLGTDGDDIITGQTSASGLADPTSVRNRFLGYGGADTLSGSVGADTLDGGRGADSLQGGADGDVLDARDGAQDQAIGCGTGTDTAYLDGASATATVDPAPTSCETQRYEGG